MTNPSCADWVIVGVGTIDGMVGVLASKDLIGGVDVTYERPHRYDVFDEWLEREYGRIYELKVSMRKWILITAPTYQEALRRLFEGWTPEPDKPDHQAIQAETTRKIES